MNQCKCSYQTGMPYSEMATAKYMDAYDSYYCEQCDTWLHDGCKCGDKECWFTGRPVQAIILS